MQKHVALPGPSIIPVTSRIFSSLVTIRIPSGGLFFSSEISRIKRRMVAGVTDYDTRKQVSMSWVVAVKLQRDIPYCECLKLEQVVGGRLADRL